MEAAEHRNQRNEQRPGWSQIICLHNWLGLVTGILLAIVAVTGSLLIYLMN